MWKWLKNVDQTNLELASGKQVLQKGCTGRCLDDSTKKLITWGVHVADNILKYNFLSLVKFKTDYTPKLLLLRTRAGSIFFYKP